MTTPNLRSSTPHKARGAQTAETAAGMHNVSRMATVAFVAVAVIALLFVRWGLETGNWQPWAASSILAGYGILTLLSAWWSWRGRSVGAVLLMLGGMLVLMPAIMPLAANVGPALASCLVLVTLVMATQMASSRLAGRAIVVSVVVGIATLLLDLYWPVERLAAPTELVIALYVIVAAIILALGFLVVRQFNDYSQRTKLIIAFLAVTLVPLALLTYLNQGATQQALTEAANTKLYAAALQTAGSIDNFIEANRSAIETETRLPDLINYLDLPPDQRRGRSR